jgi:RimJ/RimL family protein N-acetyltransferase
MDSTVLFRDFEERDIDFIYHCKNDAKLNSMIVGQFHPFTYEEATKWVHGCMGEHDNYKFWAICTNDEDKRIIGWASLSEIDKDNKSACQHGIVIGDPSYRDGTAMFEAMLLSMEYAFNTLNIHRLYCSCLSEHQVSPHLLFALGFKREGEHKDSIYQNGRFYNVLDFAILRPDFNDYRTKDLYNFDILTRKFIQSVKFSRNK